MLRETLFIVMLASVIFSCGSTSTSRLAASVPKAIDARKGLKEIVKFLQEVAGEYQGTNGPEDSGKLYGEFYFLVPPPSDEEVVKGWNSVSKIDASETKEEEILKTQANFRLVVRTEMDRNSPTLFNGSFDLSKTTTRYALGRVGNLHHGSSYIRVRKAENSIEKAYYFLEDNSDGSENGKTVNWGIIQRETFKGNTLTYSVFKIKGEKISSADDAGKLFDMKYEEKLFADTKFQRKSEER